MLYNLTCIHCKKPMTGFSKKKKWCNECLKDRTHNKLKKGYIKLQKRTGGSRRCFKNSSTFNMKKKGAVSYSYEFKPKPCKTPNCTGTYTRTHTKMCEVCKTICKKDTIKKCSICGVNVLAYAHTNAPRCPNCYKRKPSKKAESKIRPYTYLSDYLLTIYHFEGDNYKVIAFNLSRDKEDVKNRIELLQSSGEYAKLINIWKISAPQLYARAVRKKEKRLKSKN